MADKPQAEEAKAPEKTMTLADMKQMAHDYAVPMSEGTLKEISQDMTPERAKAFEDYIKTTAQGLYPTLAPQIAAGIKTAYLLDPYRQVAKQMLGEEAEPNFVADPKASAALSGGRDPKTGRPVPMSLDEWKGHIQTHPGFGWKNTPAAHETMANVLQGLAQEMGAGAETPSPVAAEPAPAQAPAMGGM